MTDELERRARDLFLEVCDLSPEARRAVIAARAGGDPDLERAVEGLLAEDSNLGTFLEAPALGGDFHLSGPYDVTGRLPGADDSAFEQHPEAIGPYRILDVIGSGGMGIVYRAEQQRPRRPVALKVLRAGLPDSRAYTCFELEAEALGRLTHPAIAQIYEAGTADFGRGRVPFLAMELVQGVDLSQHMTERGLDLRARVALLVEVCRAVHHAHQKGVIHRDLKPGNILVNEAGRPKVLDFGLAQLSDEERSRSIASGDARSIVGTLPYMSPEQVAGRADAVDARTDVYSLGATAYEIVAGHPPFDLSGLSLPAALARVAQGEPEPLRRTAPELDPDLAAVVEMAVSREREARYESAAALADDLARWLRSDPVRARPIGRLEHAARFARRNKLLVAGTATLVLTLVAGIVATAWQANSARRQAERAHAIQIYLQNTLRSAADPRTDGREQPVSHMLARAAHDLDTAFEGDPLTHAELADTLGMAFFENGRYAEARELVGAALEARAAELGPNADATLASRSNLGIVLIALGRHEEAERCLRAALAGRRATLGDEDERTQRTANWLGQVLLQRMGADEAEALFADSWAVRRRTLGETALATLATRERLALAWRRQGRVADAERALREILETEREVCGPEDFELYETLNNLSTLLLDLGRYAEAEGMAEEAHGGYVQLRGAEHPDSIVVRDNLEIVRSQLVPPDRHAAAEASPATAGGPAPERAAEELRPRDYPILVARAAQRFYKGELAEAEQELRTAVEALEAFGGQEHYLHPARQCLASVLLERGRTEEALALQREILVTHVEGGTQRSQYALIARASLAETLRRTGALDEALEQAREAYAALLEEAGERALYTLSARANLAAVLADLGRLDEALVHGESTLRVAEDLFSSPSAYTEMFRCRFGRILTMLGRFADAERELLEAHGVLVGLSPRGPYTLKTEEALVALYEANGDAEQAAHWRAALAVADRAAVEAGSATPGGEH